jgi:tetratricopeptide (TPR) repeat protein
MLRALPRAIMLAVLLALAPAGAWADTGDLDPQVQSHLDSLPDDATRIEYLEGLIADGDDDYALHFHLGNLYFDQQQMEKAAQELERSVEIKPDFLKGIVNLGSTYDEMGLLDKALETYEKALALDPDEEKTLCNIGGVHFKKRRVDLALDAFLRALEANPQSQLAHYNLAILFADAGIYGEAITEWQKAADIDSSTDLGSRSLDNIQIIKDMQKAEVPNLDG